jgi:hypothetical protein
MEENKNWHNLLKQLPQHEANPDLFTKINNELAWSKDLNSLPEYTFETNNKFGKSKKTYIIIALIILVISLILITLSLFNNHKTNVENVAIPSSEYANESSIDDFISKSFEEFCYDFQINCENLGNQYLEEQWERNRASYLLTEQAISQYGESDLLNQQLTRLRINQTVMISELLNEIQS